MQSYSSSVQEWKYGAGNKQKKSDFIYFFTGVSSKTEENPSWVIKRPQKQIMFVNLSTCMSHFCLQSSAVDTQQLIKTYRIYYHEAVR